MEQLKKIKRQHLNELWDKRNLTVKETLNFISQHPDLKMLLTVAGVWWLTRLAFVLTIAGNVIYYIYRIFHLILA